MSDFSDMRFTDLADGDDGRGHSFTIPAFAQDLVRQMSDVHLATIRRGEIRGNHHHLHRDEIILVYASDQWECAFDRGEGTEIEVRRFGAGGVMIEVVRGWSHAIKNTGEHDLVMVGMATEPYDPDDPDAHRRVVAT